MVVLIVYNEFRSNVLYINIEFYLGYFMVSLCSFSSFWKFHVPQAASTFNFVHLDYGPLRDAIQSPEKSAFFSLLKIGGGRG